MKRRHLLAGGAAALALPNLAAAQNAKTVHFVPQADLALLDPVFNTALVTRNHGFLVFDQLYGLDDSLQPQPQMVEGHVVEDDGRTWTHDVARGHDVPRRHAGAGARCGRQHRALGPQRPVRPERAAPSPTSCRRRPTGCCNSG